MPGNACRRLRRHHRLRCGRSRNEHHAGEHGDGARVRLPQPRGLRCVYALARRSDVPRSQQQGTPELEQPPERQLPAVPQGTAGVPDASSSWPHHARRLIDAAATSGTSEVRTLHARAWRGKVRRSDEQRFVALRGRPQLAAVPSSTERLPLGASQSWSRELPERRRRTQAVTWSPLPSALQARTSRGRRARVAQWAGALDGSEHALACRHRRGDDRRA
jgi:hypothetical protein